MTLDAKHDDNLIGLSARDRAAFLHGSDPFPTTLKTVDDLENDLELRPSIRSRLPENLMASAEYRVKFVHRLRNGFSDYQTHSIALGLRPRVTGYKWSLRLRASLLPSFYLRAYRDRDYNNEFHSARYRNTDYGAVLRYRFWEPLWLEGGFGKGTYYYNRKFTEYDSEYHEYQLGGDLNAPLSLTLSASYVRRISDNVGKDQTGSHLASPINPAEIGDSEYGDADYNEDDWLASVSRDVLFKRLPPTDWSVSYRFRRRVYTTDRTVELDPFHRGRLDKRGHLRYGLGVKLSSQFRMGAFGVYEERRTDSPVPDVPAVKDFVRREYGLMVTYHLR